VRAVFFLLVFANLAFLAWAEWVDAPQPAPANEAYAKLPRLKLVNELPATDARPSSGNDSANGAGSARKTALELTPPTPVATSRCLSVGPFDDQPSATRGASQLREQGLAPRQRIEKGEISKGFWVYIGGLKTDGDVADVLRTLEQSHIEDAHVMSDAGDVHRVSVGLFSERGRADRRAESLQKLGLHPEVAERKLPATLFWMDMDLPAGSASPTAPTVQDAASTGGAASRVGFLPCPTGAPPYGTSPSSPGTAEPFRTKVAGAAPAPKVP
jgi:cell division septation protein DedD